MDPVCVVVTCAVVSNTHFSQVRTAFYFGSALQRQMIFDGTLQGQITLNAAYDDNRLEYHSKKHIIKLKVGGVRFSF